MTFTPLFTISELPHFQILKLLKVIYIASMIGGLRLTFQGCVGEPFVALLPHPTLKYVSSHNEKNIVNVSFIHKYRLRGI